MKRRRRSPAPKLSRPPKRRRTSTPPASSTSGKTRPRSTATRRRGRLITPEEMAQLQDQLREALETLDAIRSGEVDAMVVQGANGSQVYSLTGAEQPYRVYVERMQEGAVTVSSDGMILYCNQRFAEMLAQPLECVISSELRHHLPGDAWESIRQVLHDGDGVVKQTANARRADGISLPVQLTASRLPLEGQDVLCLVVTDLTEQMEKAQLRVEKEIAEKASQAKDAFLARLSHELRTPLTPALLATVALEEDRKLPQALRNELSMIRRNVELEARLIDDLLDLTRVTRGKLELQMGPTDVHAVILRAIETCRADLLEKQQNLTVRLEAERCITTADPVRLQQVMWNLLRNAVKFTGREGSVTVTTGNTTDGMWVQVTDSGIGFEPSTAEHLFDAFEQGGREITQQFGGLGLGLTISRSIAEAHGGELQAESAGPHRGATFTFRLPLRSPARSSTVAAAAEGKPAATPGLRVLLIEDHKDTRLSMERLLRRHRIEVVGAGTAAEALSAAKERTFDLVISDLGLPDQSGLELMEQLRDRHGLRGVAISGYGMEEDLARSRAAGFVHHLTKPVDPKRLRAVLAEVVGDPGLGPGK